MPTLGVLVAVTAGLVASHPQTAPYFRRTRSFQGLNSAFGGRATALGTVLAPSSLYVAGLVRKDSYAKNTALLAGEAVADSEILTTVLKDIDGEIRPASVPPNGNFADTWFEGRGSILRGNGSGPHNRRIFCSDCDSPALRPPTSLGSHCSLWRGGRGRVSRITLSSHFPSSHFPSDVFMGAALGYSIGRFAVLQQ